MRLLYLSPVHAESFAQRPHFMMRAWLEEGVDSILWVNPYPCRLPEWNDLHRDHGHRGQSSLIDDRIRVLNVPAMPIEPLPFGAWVNRHFLWKKTWQEIEHFVNDDATVLGIGRPCAMADAAVQSLKPFASFYDAMDNFPEFHHGLSRLAMQRYENSIAEKVDVIIASSSFLADKFRRRGLRVEKLLNASAFLQEHELHRAKTTLNCRPVLGYIGCINRRFDWATVIQLANAAANVDIELIGPRSVPTPENLPPNIRLLPACNHREAMGYLARFSAGLIPFKDTPLTAGVDPIKYYEYRSAGLPVLSTRFGEMLLRDSDPGVFFLDGRNNLSEVVKAALSHRFAPAEIRQFRRNNDWDSRFRQTSLFRSLMSSAPRTRAA